MQCTHTLSNLTCRMHARESHGQSKRTCAHCGPWRIRAWPRFTDAPSACLCELRTTATGASNPRDTPVSLLTAQSCTFLPRTCWTRSNERTQVWCHTCGSEYTNDEMMALGKGKPWMAKYVASPLCSGPALPTFSFLAPSAASTCANKCGDLQHNLRLSYPQKNSAVCTQMRGLSRNYCRMVLPLVLQHLHKLRRGSVSQHAVRGLWQVGSILRIGRKESRVRWPNHTCAWQTHLSSN